MVATDYLRRPFTPTPAIAARVAEIVAFLADKELSAGERGRLAFAQSRPDPVAEADALDIAAPFYREASRQIAAELAASDDTADRTYSAFAAERIDTDTPAEARARFRLLMIQAGSRG